MAPPVAAAPSAAAPSAAAPDCESSACPCGTEGRNFWVGNEGSGGAVLPNPKLPSDSLWDRLLKCPPLVVRGTKRVGGSKGKGREICTESHRGDSRGGTVGEVVVLGAGWGGAQ